MNVLGIVGKITSGSSADASEPLQVLLKEIVLSNSGVARILVRGRP